MVKRRWVTILFVITLIALIFQAIRFFLRDDFAGGIISLVTAIVLGLVVWQLIIKKIN